MAKRPNAVRFDDLRWLLDAYGWELRRVRGSHHIFARGGDRLTVPLKGPHVLSIYVREALKATAREDEDGDD